MAENKEEKLINEIRRLQSLLESERKGFRSVLDSIVDGVYTTDANRRITFWNKGAERITGFSSNDVLGNSCKNLLSHVDESGNSLCDHACPLSETMNSSIPVYGKNVYSGTAWGRTVPVSVSCAPIIDGDGNITGAVEVFRDISDQKKLEKQKSEFYAMITHDIKSPLTTILGYSELITDPGRHNTDDDIKAFASYITRSANRINGLVDDFLSISKLSTGMTEPHTEPIVVEDLLRKVVGEFKPVADQNGINLSYTVGPGLPTINADPKMLERALINLVGNALKYSNGQGSVSVSAGLSEGIPGSGNPEEIKISVTDDGPGIPQEDIGRVFDIYYRSENSNHIEGTGLGLAIVKAVCEAHGGSVSLNSSPGRGSSFTMHIPVRASGAEQG